MHPPPSAPASNTSFAHHGEDRQVVEFLGGEPGVFFEAGANEPISGSQTYLLETLGWSGILVEPNPEFTERCRSSRPRSQVYPFALMAPGSPSRVRFRIPGHLSNGQACVVSKVFARQPGDHFFEADVRTMDQVLEQSGFSKLDFLSLDLEGGEADALRGFSFSRWKPRLISVEDHCENLDTHRLLRRNGYKLVRRVGDNHWYLPQKARYPVKWRFRVESFRKLYLSLPLRKLRALSRSVRGKEGI